MMYLLESTLIFSLMFGVYWMVLRQLNFIKINRFVLIGIMLSAIFLPVLDAVFYVEMAEPVTWIDKGRIAKEADRTLYTNESTFGLAFLSSDSIHHLTISLFTMYMIGLVVLLSMIFIQFFSFLFLVLGASIKEQRNGVKYVYSNKIKSPFSFFNYVFIPTNIEDELMLEQVLVHENCHARQKHSFDILLASVYRALFWFNPFAWANLKQVKLNLEYLADASVLANGFDPKQYQMNVLRISCPAFVNQLGNHFNQNFLKQRILKMKQNPSKKKQAWRYLFLLPILAFFLTSFTGEKPKTIATDLGKYYHFEGRDAFLVISDQFTQADTKALEKIFAENGINLSFEGSAYSYDGYLDAFDLLMEDERVQLTRSSKGIMPIYVMPQVVYITDNGSGIGIFNKEHMKKFPVSINQTFERELPIWVQFVRDNFPSLM